MSEMADLAGRSIGCNRWSHGKILTLLATGLLAMPATAFSTPILLDFEGVGDFNPVGSFYVANGIVFSGDDLALEEDSQSGLFVADPSSPTTAMFLVHDFGSGPYDENYQATVTLDYAAGFTSVSFLYAAIVGGFANVYDGVGGTGTLLGPTPPAGLNGNQTSICPVLICDWTTISVSFNGIAKSIVFGGATGQIGFDDITLEPATVPLPAAAWLLLSGLAGLVFSRRRAAA